jgi:hypothetical protein
MFLYLVQRVAVSPPIPKGLAGEDDHVLGLRLEVRVPATVRSQRPGELVGKLVGSMIRKLEVDEGPDARLRVDRRAGDVTLTDPGQCQVRYGEIGAKPKALGEESSAEHVRRVEVSTTSCGTVVVSVVRVRSTRTSRWSPTPSPSSPPSAKNKYPGPGCATHTPVESQPRSNSPTYPATGTLDPRFDLDGVPDTQSRGSDGIEGLLIKGGVNQTPGYG